MRLEHKINPRKSQEYGIYEGMSAKQVIVTSYSTIFILDHDNHAWCWGLNGRGVLGVGLSGTDLTATQTPMSVVGDHEFIRLYSTGQYSAMIGMKEDFSLWGWGYNNYKCLGNLLEIEYYQPTYIPGTGIGSGGMTPVSLITDSQANFSLAIDVDNKIWAWGNNSYGQLGIGSKTTKENPQIARDNSFKVIQIGSRSSWGLHDTTGKLYEWGEYSPGDSPVPIEIENIPEELSFAEMQVFNASCFLKDYNGIRYSRSAGAFGGGLSGGYTEPALYIWEAHLPDMTIFSSHDSTNSGTNGPAILGKDKNGHLWTWGQKTTYKKRYILDNDITAYSRSLFYDMVWPMPLQRNYPVDLSTFAHNGHMAVGTTASSLVFTVTDADTGYYMQSGLPRDMRYVSNDGPQLFTMPMRLEDIQNYRYWNVPQSMKYDKLSLGDDFVLSYNFAGEEVIAWGGNEGYQLGVNHDSHVSEPSIIRIGYDVDLLQAYRDNVLEIRRRHRGAMYCHVYGSNTNGRLGKYLPAIVSKPTKYMPHGRFKKVACGNYHSIALTKWGTVEAWGKARDELDNFTTLGDGVRRVGHSFPNMVQLPNTMSYIDVAAGPDTGYALDDTKHCWAWGRDYRGCLAHDLPYSPNKPVSIVGDQQFDRIYAGDHFAIAYDDTNDQAWGWGQNLGTLGDGTSTTRSSPVQVHHTSAFGKISICTEGNHVLAMDKNDDTKVWAWGDNEYGQLGTGSIYSRVVEPELVIFPPDTHIIDIAAGDTYSYFIDSDGNVWEAGNDTASPSSRDDPPSLAFDCITSPVRRVFATPGRRYVFFYDDNDILWVSKYAQSFAMLEVDADFTSEEASPVVEPVPKADDILSFDAGISKFSGDSTTNRIQAVWVDKDGSAWGAGWCADADIFIFGNYRIDEPTETNSASSTPYWPQQVGITPEFLNKLKISSTHSGYVDIRNDHLVQWGGNTYGQLGDGTTVNSDDPIAHCLNEGFSFSQITTASTSVGAVDLDGQAWTWGTGRFGSGGDNLPDATRPVPVKVVGNHTFSKLAGAGYSGYFYAALDQDGFAWSWGHNSAGQLGDNSKTNRSSPVAAHGGHVFTEIACGNYFTIAIDATDGSLWAWGRNSFGQLGINSTTDKSTPTQLLGVGIDGLQFVKISCGANHALALTDSGKLYAWGYNNQGQVGDNSTTSRSVPVAINPLEDYTDISAGEYFCVALKDNGRPYAWGDNGRRQIGDTTGVDRSTPVEVSFPAGLQISSLLRNSAHRTSYAIDVDDNVWSWGEGGYAGFGAGMIFSTSILLGSPVDIHLGFKPQDMAQIYSTHVFFLDDQGTHYWQGADSQEFGVAGTGRMEDYDQTETNYLGEPLGYRAHAPIPVYKRNPIQDMVVADDFTLLVKSGFLWGCGRNTWGQLGTGDNADKHDFQLLNETFSKINTISARTSFAVATTYDGGTYAWGAGTSGQLGNNAALDSNVPVSVVGDHSFSKVLAGSDYALALKEDGTLWAWGDNSLGQLGDGTTINKSQPIHVATAYSFKDIQVGDQVSLGVTIEGEIYLWGKNPGNGLYWEETAPPAYNVNPVLLDAGRFPFWSNQVFIPGNHLEVGLTRPHV